MELYLGDCLEVMKDIETNTIDLLFCDLPYCGITNSKKDSEISCKWNTPIDLDLFWKQVNRICKEKTPMFFTCSTKFGVSLINSNPKNFRYDLVWVKSAPCGFLNAKKMPMKKHEMIYVFYKKLPLYDLSSHRHKFLKEDKTVVRETTMNEVYESPKVTYNHKKRDEPLYDPPLPTSIVKEKSIYGQETEKLSIYDDKGKWAGSEPRYDPPLPTSILEVKSQKGKHATQKPVALIEWILKYYSKEGDVVLDPTMGSGSTGLACMGMKRHFIGIEMDEEIYKVAEERLKYKN